MPEISYDSFPPTREDIRKMWNLLYDSYKSLERQKKNLEATLDPKNYNETGDAWKGIVDQIKQIDAKMEVIGNDLLRIEMDVKIYCR